MSKSDEQGLHVPPTTRKLAGNTGWNLLGLCAPMVVALFAIPLLIKGLGEARFGTLTIVWMLVGYFSVFDLGLGRAMTKLTAEKLGQRKADELPAIFWTSMGMMLLLGLFGAALVAGLTPWLVHHRLHIPLELQAETLKAFMAAAIGLPVVVTTTGLIGILESHQRFRLINTIRIPVGMYTFLGPLLVLPFSNSLFPVVTALIVGRVVEWLIYFSFCLRVIPALRSNLHFTRSLVRPLLTFGGWMTVSNIAMPVMIQIDRFIIGAIRTVSEVTFYVTPAEIVVKLLIFPRAWVSVLFPSFAAQYASNPEHTATLYARGVKYLLAMSFPVVLIVNAFAGEGLQLWLGSDFAVRSLSVMRWLTTGIFVYSLAYIPFSLLQSVGRPDLSAKLHMIELPLFLILCTVLTRQYGIEGTAIAWFARVVLETFCMFALAHRFVRSSKPIILRSLWMTGVALSLIGITISLPSLWTRLGTCVLGSLVFVAASWLFLLSKEERSSLVRFLQKGGKGA
jgi:O-antigen/teichoic acid export membrane protein